MAKKNTSVEIVLNEDGTFSDSKGKELRLRDVIAMARERREAASADRKKANESKKAERAKARLERAEKRAEKAKAELEKAKQLAA